MQFRHLRAADLDGSADVPGLAADLLNNLNAEQCAFLLLAPPGTGKSAAVGSLAKKTGKSVVMCNLLQVLEYPDSAHQLKNLLLACQSQRDTLVYLDKVDELIETWNRDHPEELSRMADQIKEWLDGARGQLIEEGSMVICTGRNASLVPGELRSSFDRVVTA